MKTLQDLITEKFNAGEGEQDLRLTVLANNHTNLEVRIGEGKYTVVGDVLGRVDAGAPETETTSGGNGEGDGTGAPSGDHAGTGVGGEDVDGGNADSVSEPADVNAPAGTITTGPLSSYEPATGTFADGAPTDPRLKDVLEFFGADDIEQLGEAVIDGADIFALKKNGEIIEQGTLRELEEVMRAKREQA